MSTEPSPSSGKTLAATGWKHPWEKPQMRVMPEDVRAERERTASGYAVPMLREEYRRGFNCGYFRPENYAPVDAAFNAYCTGYDDGCARREFDLRYPALTRRED